MFGLSLVNVKAKISCFQLKTQKKAFWSQENSSSEAIGFYAVLFPPEYRSKQLNVKDARNRSVAHPPNVFPRVHELRFS